MAGLYIHFPFCHSKCRYCDFYSVAETERIRQFTNGIIAEHNHRKDELSRLPETIYFGGGTPSSIPDKQLVDIINAVMNSRVIEFTIEVNPEDITPEKVQLWKDCGINRVSMGIQSLDDNLLNFLGRRHSSGKALAALEVLINSGIKNISVDLIYGIPKMTDEIWEKSLRTLLSYPVSHLSAYCLTYHSGTPLYNNLVKGVFNQTDDITIERQFNILRCITADTGFEHYEISNFARQGCRSKHNSSYWSPHSEWLGLGPSAHSFTGNRRKIDHVDLNQWLHSIPAPYSIEEETAIDLINDNIVTALRTSDGLDLREIPEKFRTNLLRNANRFISSGDMVYDNDRLSIIPSKWLISDLFIRELLIDD